MADRWYYVHGALRTDSARNGPFSSRELTGLVASGQIVPTDTVWKEGIEKGVLARRVRNLFPPGPVLPAVSAGPPFIPVPSPALASPEAPAPANPPPAIKPELASSAVEVGASQPAKKPELGPVNLPDDIGLLPEGEAPVQPGIPPLQPKHVRKGRAVAGKGAMIVGQDGTHVKFKKKCTTCGHEESTRHTLKIANGVTRIAFFCPKCRKRREVEINGYLTH